MLDAVKLMLRAVLPPAVARRMSPPVIEDYDAVVKGDGRRHHVFLQAELEPDHGRLSVLQIHVVSAAAP